MSRKRTAIVITLAILFIVAFTITQIGSNTPALAQDDPLPPTATSSVIVIPTLDVTYEPDPMAVHQTDYRIVYFIAEGAVAEAHLTSATSITQATQAQVAYTAEDVANFNAAQQIDALLIHESAYDIADRDWIASAAREGLVIGTINMHIHEVAELVDSDCARQTAANWKNPYTDQGVDYYYVSSSLHLADNPAEQSLVDEMAYTQCQRNPAIQGKVFGYANAVQGALRDTSDFEGLRSGLILQIAGLTSMRQSFVSRYLPPTVVPNLPPEPTATPLSQEG